MQLLDNHIRNGLNQHLEFIEKKLNANVVAIFTPIIPGQDLRLRDAVDLIANKKSSIAVILDTPGGIVEVVERMVTVLRHAYQDVTVIVPDRAMSAGTIFALSADRIMMDYFSCLGPIDPQIEKDEKLVPALAYLSQFERLNKKCQSGNLTTAEYTLLNKLDLGELYQFEQARELSIELLIKWLSQYKFKNWERTESRGAEVTQDMKKTRAKEIAALLNDTERWHSHGRGIDMRILQSEVNLKIDNLAEHSELHKCIHNYFELLQDYMNQQQLFSFIQTKEYF